MMTTQQSNALRLADALTEKEYPPRRAAAEELRRLHEHEVANNAWGEKTEWVQQTVQPHELGMHRADVLRQRIDRLHERFAALVAAAEREACAKVCDDLWQEDGTAYDCREAIRARGNDA